MHVTSKNTSETAFGRCRKNVHLGKLELNLLNLLFFFWGGGNFDLKINVFFT